MTNVENSPLSYAEERFWFEQQVDHQSTHNNLVSVCRVNGQISIEVLDASLRELANHHDILRTVYNEENGTVKRIVKPHADKFVHSTQSSLQDTILCEQNRVFSLSLDPLMRISIVHDTNLLNIDRPVKLSEDILPETAQDQYLVFCCHHIIFDGWSWSIFWRDLGAIYTSTINHAQNLDCNLDISYESYASTQRQVGNSAFSDTLSFWKNQLCDQPSLMLPTDNLRPATQSNRGTSSCVVFSTRDTQNIFQTARDERLTPFMLMFSMFYIYIRRLSGIKDVTVGIPTNNREQTNHEHIIGCFVNSLAIRCDPGETVSCLDVFRNIRSTLLDAHEHRHTPFEKVVEHLNPIRTLSRNTLFQVFFNMNGDRKETLKLGEVELTPIDVSRNSTIFDIECEVNLVDGQLHVELCYNSDLFTPATITRYTECYETIVKAAIEARNTPVDKLPLLNEQQLAHVVNNAKPPIIDNGTLCVHDLFANQVERTPDAIAIRDLERELNYVTVDRMAESLAKQLRAAGASQKHCIAISLERNSDMLIVLLAVLKTGCAYVPIDPSLPTQRVKDVVTDSQVDLVVTSTSTLNKFEISQRSDSQADVGEAPLLVSLSNSTIKSLNMGLLPDEEYNENKENKTDELHNNQSPAYIIYTSGSTGKPKGVVVPHAAVVNFLLSMQRQPGIDQGDTLLAVTTFSFDISILELLLPLVSGASVFIAPKHIVSDGAALTSLIQESKATIMQATPATWQLMINSGWHCDLPIKALCGGEQLTKFLAQALLDRCQSVWNMYGPTETTIWSSIKRVTSSAAITIGKAIDNTHIVILDENVMPVPAGIVGEVYIGGEGLALGYWNNPELTKEKFVHVDILQNKYHRVGDRARQLPNGEIEILGRLDNQIKLHGYRIDLNEIEHHILETKLVDDVVATKYMAGGEEDLSSHVLVAYIVTSDTVCIADIRNRLRSTLPTYMLPSKYVQLSSLPRTTSGKVSRNLLPAPSADSLLQTPRKQSTFNRTEEILHTIFCDVLNVSSLNLDDNFFFAGGHSLLALKLFSEIEKKFKIELPVSSIFESGTIELLASTIDKTQGSDASKNLSSLLPLRETKKPSAPTLILVHPASGHLLVYTALVKLISSDVNVYGLQFVEGTTPSVQSISELAQSYADEISLMNITGEVLLAGYCLGGALAVEIAAKLQPGRPVIAKVVLLDSFNTHACNINSYQHVLYLSNLAAQKFRRMTNELIKLNKGGRIQYVQSKFRMARYRFQQVTDKFLIRSPRGSIHDKQNKLANSKARECLANGSPVRHSQSQAVSGDKIKQEVDHISIVNEQANFQHIPTAYEGKVLLIKEYRRYGLPQYFGWESVVSGELRSIQLRLDYNGMLMGENAAEVAELLNKELMCSQI